MLLKFYEEPCQLLGYDSPFLRYRGHLEFYCFWKDIIIWGAQGANGRKPVDCGAAVLIFGLISDYSLCCIALTEYMLCILWIVHDFIALQNSVFVVFPDQMLISLPSASYKSIWRPYRKKGLFRWQRVVRDCAIDNKKKPPIVSQLEFSNVSPTSVINRYY
jgi:hypothetical protein